MTVKKVFVGKYKTIGDSKKDEKQLRELGLTPHLFSVSAAYSLLVFTSVSESAAENACNTLLSKGFEAFIV